MDTCKRHPRCKFSKELLYVASDKSSVRSLASSSLHVIPNPSHRIYVQGCSWSLMMDRRSEQTMLGFNCILSDVSTVHRPIETKILSLPISTRVAQEEEHYVLSWIHLDCPRKLLCTVLESPGPSILSKERFVVSNEGNALVIVRTQAELVS